MHVAIVGPRNDRRFHGKKMRGERVREEMRKGMEGGGVKSVDRKLHVLQSHKFSVSMEFPVARRHATFRLATTFRRDKRSLLITPRVLDARLIAGITGINARVRWQTRGMFVLRNKRTSVLYAREGRGKFGWLLILTTAKFHYVDD